MLKFSPWGHSKGTYVLLEGGEGTPKRCENVQGTGVFQEDMYAYLKQCFHIFTALFVFHFFDGKVQTLTPWKIDTLYIAVHLTLPRYLDISL